ncbi:hypothetical protein [Azospirillum sp. sgz302134]
MRPPHRHSLWRTLRTTLAAGLTLMLAAGCETYDPGNPLIGRWTLTAPIGMGMALGTYEFRRSSMRALGIDMPVSYAVSGNTVTVVPESFGPTLEIDLIDQDTARLRDPLTGGLMTLHRLRS